MSLTLQQRLETLWGLERRKSKLGLDGTRALLAAFDHPERSFQAVHVAGTNGKGSVCTLIERVLRAAGHTTGLFTSPHLVDFRERIRVNGRWADAGSLEQLLERAGEPSDAGERTFFEVATAIGFAWFARAGVTWAVVEVGLGGRLDTTNVLSPALTVITPVGLDHTDVLGDTLAAIAGEKAGIVKPGVPVVVAPQEAESGAVIARAAEGAGTTAIAPVPVRHVTLDRDGARFEADVAPWGPLALSIALRGRHQLANAATALTALSNLAQAGVAIPARAVVEGFAAARWPGRLEPCPAEPRLWWDGGHNAHGIATLLTAWREDLKLPAPSAVVLALSRDKDVAAVAARLAAAFPGAVLVATRTGNERALDPTAIAAAGREAGLTSRVATDVPSAVREALSGCSGHVLLTGSLFAVGEAMQAFGGAPGEQA